MLTISIIITTHHDHPYYQCDQAARSQLAPRGVLRAGINLSNFLLVTGKDEQVMVTTTMMTMTFLTKMTIMIVMMMETTAQGHHKGVSPGIAKSLAESLSVPLELVAFPGPGASLSIQSCPLN